MSQLPMNPGIYAEETLSEPPRLSGLAIAALVCALIFCVPLLPLLGVILGLVAIVMMIGRTHVRGRGLAIAAIVIGLVISAGQAAFGWWSYRFVNSFVVLFQNAPIDTMNAGYAGDYAAFRQQLLGAALEQDDAAIQSFIDALDERWGTLTSLEMKPDQRQPAQPPPGSTASTAELEYIANFGGTTVPAVVEFRFEPIDAASGGSGTGGSTMGGFLRMGISSFTFKDPDRGDIRFPKLPPPPKSADDASGAEPGAP